MESVIAELFIRPQEDQNAACDPNGKARDVDEGIPLVIFYGPQSDFKVILNHRDRVLNLT